MEGRIVPTIQVVSPLSSPIVAGAPPLYGTWTILTPPMSPTIAPARCVEVPAPPEPKVTWPGRARAIAMSSLTDLAGSDGWPSTTFGPEATRITGSRSRMGSYGSLRNAGFEVWLVDTMSSV